MKEKQEIIEKFSEVFIKSLKMLEQEIEENHENINSLYDIENLVVEWNELYEKYIEKEGE